jgi:outer membrane receptor protein involved in Fe transport
LDNNTIDTINYKINKTSVSVGGNYALTKDTAIYARISDGYNFAADRLLYGARGALNGKPVSFNRLQQQELGVKHRQGNLSLFGTLFTAKTDESNYEATTRLFTANTYDAKGIEMEASYRIGNFRVNGGATLLDSEITNSRNPVEIGNKPRRQANVVYSLSPSYRIGDLQLGAAVIGSGKSFGDDANTITMPAFSMTNLFASYRINKSTTASLSVNNAFNKLAYTEVEGSGHAARAFPGRTARINLRYDF